MVDGLELQAMGAAKYLFEHSRYMDAQGRYDAVRSLAEYGLFSTGHLARIAGVSETTVRRYGIDVTGTAGKFNPESLDTLIRMRLDSNTGKEPNPVLVSLAIQSGNSYRIVSKLTGVGRSRIARIMNDPSNQGDDL